MTVSKQAAQRMVADLAKHISLKAAGQMQAEIDALPDEPKRSKYGVAPKEERTWTSHDGQSIVFDSKKEMVRWLELTRDQVTGKIHGLDRQFPFVFLLDDKPLFTYIADFVYYKADGTRVVEDVKGYKKGTAWQHFKLKKALIESQFGLTITIV